MKMNDLLSDIENMQSADNMVTNILELLEDNKYKEAQECCQKAYKLSQSIEQRFAIKYIMFVAKMEDPIFTAEILQDTYNYSR